MTQLDDVFEQLASDLIDDPEVGVSCAYSLTEYTEQSGQRKEPSASPVVLSINSSPVLQYDVRRNAISTEQKIAGLIYVRGAVFSNRRAPRQGDRVELKRRSNSVTFGVFDVEAVLEHASGEKVAVYELLLTRGSRSRVVR